MKNKFSRKIKADKDAFYMSCPEVVAEHIANQLISFKTAVELCSAVGMLTVQLAKAINKVYAVDISKKRTKQAQYNAKLYKVSRKTKFICGNVLDENLLNGIKAEVAILDPDWSKEKDKSIHVKSIDDTQPSLRTMFNLTKKYITKNMVSRIPKNFTFKTIKDLGPCKIENIFWKNKLRFKIAYFFSNIKNNKEVNINFD